MCLIRSDGAALGDVDTIQKLSDILVSNEAGLVNLRTGAGNSFQIITGHHNLILNELRSDDVATRLQSDGADTLLTQEVSDLDDGAVASQLDVDGEMRIDETHLVFESLSHTGNHILHMGDAGLKCAELLAVTMMLLHNQSAVLVLQMHVDEQMGEVSVQRSARTGDTNLTGLQ